MLLTDQTRAPLILQTTSTRRKCLNLKTPVHRNSAIYASLSGLRTTSSERSVSSIYVDFDDTISDGLTVALQLKAVTQGAARLLGDEDKAKKLAKDRVGLITQMTELYEKEAAEMIERILQNHCLDSFDRNAIDEVMKVCGEFDVRWVKKVISSNVFQGATREDFLSLASQTPLQPDALSTLSSFQTSGIEVSILSINWSAEWIQSTIGQGSNVITNGNHAPCGSMRIFSNEMVYGEDGVSTGDVTRVMWSGQEKAKRLEQLLIEEQDPNGGLSVFIGDSYYDIQPLLMADIGIIIGDNKEIFKFAEAFGIQIQPLMKATLTKQRTTSEDAPILYNTQSWAEIRDVILRKEIVQSIVSSN